MSGGALFLASRSLFRSPRLSYGYSIRILGKLAAIPSSSSTEKRKKNLMDVLMKKGIAFYPIQYPFPLSHINPLVRLYFFHSYSKDLLYNLTSIHFYCSYSEKTKRKERQTSRTNNGSAKRYIILCFCIALSTLRKKE